MIAVGKAVGRNRDGKYFRRFHHHLVLFAGQRNDLGGAVKLGRRFGAQVQPPVLANCQLFVLGAHDALVQDVALLNQTQSPKGIDPEVRILLGDGNALVLIFS